MRNKYWTILLSSIFTLGVHAIHSATASDICVSLSSVYDGASSIALNASWFADVDGSALRVQVEDTSKNKSYLYLSAEAKEIVWHPQESGDYTLTIQEWDGDSWIDTTYVRQMTVKDIATATADDIALDLTVPYEQGELELFVSRDRVRESANIESLTYSSIWATNSTAEASAVIKVMPILKQLPKYLVVDLSGGTNATSYGLSYLDDVPNGGWSDEYKTSKLVLRHIPAGSFVMGGRVTDYPAASNVNLHKVTVTRDFYMSIFEITQRQWELIVGNRPSKFGNETCYMTRPVDNIAYTDIRGADYGITWPLTCDVDDDSFLSILRRKTGLSGFDLPTEAQWEYSCRAGTTTALNTGENLSVASYPCSEIDPVARYIGNSNSANMSDEEQEASIDEYCSAKVGTYNPNTWGLYDMHGNLWEWCLDRATETLQGSVDPEGTNDVSLVNRVIRGGAFNENAWRCSSMSRYSDENGVGYPQTNAAANVGFRLCLQGGDLPDFAEAATILNEAGSGKVNWSPKKAGTYYLTHTTMNAQTNAQLLSAWFEVAEPKLSLVPQGELTNNVELVINGGEEGWTIRYTTDGSAPTTTSSVYEGAFSLPLSGTVRAVAYNAQGVASEELCETLTLHDSLSLVGATARQRYPWNGKVDVDCELKGDPAKLYRIALVAKDLDSDTKLLVETVRRIGTEAESKTFLLQPGRYRFVWDADTDITSDGDFPRVAVSVTAESSEASGLRIAEQPSTIYSSVVLVWEADDKADGYNVYRTIGSVTEKLATVTKVTYTDNLSYGINATYYVRAVFAGCEGSESNHVSARGMVLGAPEGALVYLPMDGEEIYDETEANPYKVKNYGTESLSFFRFSDDLAWLWLADRDGCEPGAMYAEGKENSCLRFPDQDVFCISNSFTVAFWCRPELGLSKIVAEKNSGNYGVIEAHYPYVLGAVHGGDTGEAGLGIAVGTNGIAVVEHAGAWFPATLVYSSEIGMNWTHVAVTIEDNGGAVLYVNGVKVRTGLKSTKVKKITNTLIGCGSYGEYKGFIDDFFIFNRALSAEEVARVYKLDTAGEATIGEETAE